MVHRWKSARLICYMAVIFIFLVTMVRTSSSLPFQLSVREVEMFPCQDCHQDIPADSKQDEIEAGEHDHISVQHGGLRCLDCHNAENRDLLQTIDHRLVSFSDMEKICGGCHAAAYHDWKEGIHGKLLGSWNGVKWGLRCVECHDVHKPKPIALKPENPPQPPAAAPAWLAWP